MAAPTIATQPQAASVSDGQSTTLSVAAGSADGVSFQWLLNGTAIPGATAASYTTPPLKYGAANQFSVRLTNSGGSVTSQVVNVAVSPVPPTIDVQPLAATSADGSDAGFGVHVQGSEPLAYQWLRNGSPIDGANGSSLNLPAVALADSTATFSVRVSNAAGSVSSQSVQLTVTPVAAQIKAAPTAQTVLDGATATFSVVTRGSAPLSIQWKVDGQPVSGATDTNFTLPAVYAKTGQQVSVTVSNSYGTASSVPVSLTVSPQAPRMAVEPQSYTVGTGASATLTETATGTQPLSYQWQQSQDNGSTWTDIAGANSASYALSNITLAQANARYRVAVTNVAGTVASAAAILKVQANVHIISGATGGLGYADGVGSDARFSYLNSIVTDVDGSLLVGDSNGVLRRVASDGSVTTVAGLAGMLRTLDGSSSSARFGYISALARDPAGNIYIGDTNTLRVMTPQGVVSTIAGDANGIGNVDGNGPAARFGWISALAVTSTGNIVVVDSGSKTIRVATPQGQVTTLAGTVGASGYANGPGANASFTQPASVALDAQDNIYVLDSNSVRRITPAGVVSLWAGTPGTAGSLDGPFASALLNNARSLAFDAAGNLFVGEATDMRVLRTDGQTTTIAGVPGHNGLDVDGSGPAAVLSGINAMSWRPTTGDFAFVEFSGSVRTLSTTGRVGTLAGTRGWPVDADGTLATAVFANPGAVVSDTSGTLYLISQNALRRIDTSGHVQTIPTGLPYECLYAASLALDAAGNVFIGSNQCHQVFKVTPAGVATTLAGQYRVAGGTDGPATQSTLNWPQGIAVDAAGNVFVADSVNNVIRKVDPAGNTSTFAGKVGEIGPSDGVGSAARFFSPRGIAIDADGNLFVTDNGASNIRKITPAGLVSTVAGYYTVTGVSNGEVTRFNAPTAIALDASGNLYIADTGNNLIQRVSPNGWAWPVIGKAGLEVLRPGVDGAINKPAGVAVLPNGRLVFTSEQAIVGD